MISD
jgi:hypothetical protein